MKIIKLGDDEEIRVQVIDLKGVKYIDTRLFVPEHGEEELAMSKKGITLRVNHVEEPTKTFIETRKECAK